MKTSNLTVFGLLALALAITIMACQKEEDVSPLPTTTESLFEDLGLNFHFRLDKEQIDDLLMEKYGTVESEFPKRAELIFNVINQKIYASFAKQLNTRGLEPDCLISEDPDINFTTGRRSTGIICEEDLFLKSLVLGRFSDGTEVLDADGRELDLGIDTNVSASAQEDVQGLTLLFGAVEGSISTVDGPNGDGIVLKQFSLNEDIFCDPSEFGDGLRLSARTRVRDTTPDDGEMSYRIDLAIKCRD